MNKPRQLKALRAASWSALPSSPGVYWWFFPPAALECLRISDLSDVSRLRLRRAPDGQLCLYHGMANNLAERVKWHAAQKLTPGALRSGFLSTFRFTLLALNDFDYTQGATQIDRFFDGMSVAWLATATRKEAELMEQAELQGDFDYPLNIQGNRQPELAGFIRHLKSTRRTYKRKFVPVDNPVRLTPDVLMASGCNTVYLVSCVSRKQERACQARDLYISSLFRKARAYIERSASRWYILSAEHGLVTPEQVIEPYERTLNRMGVADRRAWARRVATELADAEPELSRVVFLAGSRYREFLSPHLLDRGVAVSVPMQGLGIGEQLRWLGQNSPPPC